MAIINHIKNLNREEVKRMEFAKYSSSPAERRFPTHQLAARNEWGRQKCDEVSLIGLALAASGIAFKHCPSVKAGTVLAIGGQLIKELFFPRR